MKAQTCTNLVTMFYEQVEAFGEHPFLWSKQSGKYRPLTWRETAAQVTELARGLKALGVRQGDRVVLVSENRPEWLIADLAIMAIGAITVPAYTTNTTDDHRHIVDNSGAIGMIVSTQKLADFALPAAHLNDQLRFAISIDQLDLQQSLNVEVIDWKTALNLGQNDHKNIIKDAERFKRTDVACIIYTSGTGGVPKGVVLSHGAMMHNLVGATKVLAKLGLKDEVFLSFLPLSHSYEHTAGQFFPISIGAQIYYAEGADKLLMNMAECNPTIIMAVPRLYEMMHTRILNGMEKSGPKALRYFNKTLDLGTKAFQAPNTLTFREKMVNFALDKFVRHKMRQRFGGRLKAFVSGGAPLNPEIGTFFTALGVCILQGYGQTESGPVVSVNVPGNVKMHGVGPALENTEIRIADDGEILIKGELVMNGYWQDEKATREALVDGWLHTGDIGLLDDDQHLVITDRKKDIIVNSGGDNIAPQRIEGMLTLEPQISQAMVYGDNRSHVVALLVPHAEWLSDWAEDLGKACELSKIYDDPDLHAAMSETISRVNQHLSNIETVRKFIIASEAFCVENAQLTPTLKVRRHKIKDVYGTQLESLYV